MHSPTRFILAIIVLAWATAFWTVPLQAEPAKKFAVLPFEIHGPDQYAYLGQGVRSMLVSRLQWADRFEDLDRARVDKSVSSTPTTLEEVQDAVAALEVDYLIFGSVTILGDQASLDVRVVDEQGNDNARSAQVPLDDLIPTLEGVAKEINQQVFGKPDSQPAVSSSGQAARPAHPDLIYNEYGPEQTPYHLNPAILYSGSTDSPGRWRSQALPFASLGVVVGDADDNGQNEIILLRDNKVMAYRVTDNKLMPLAEYEAPLRLQCLNINLFDMDRDGYPEIIVSAIEEDTPRSFILNLIDGRFVPVDQRIPFYLNVVGMPPENQPMLIGQKKGHRKLFDSGVHEMLPMGETLDLGPQIDVPKGANVFNFAYLPQEEDYKVVLADHNDKLQVFSSKNAFQAVTDESYAGSALGLEVSEALPGIRQDPNNELTNYYYIPSRLVPVRLNREGNWNLLVNRNISLSAQFFSRYRYFPQGEIHALFWDGINLNINWKTRRIKGTVVDYGLADVKNSGETALYVLVNTHPGMTGFSQRRTILLSYTLDLDEAPEDGATLDLGLE